MLCITTRSCEGTYPWSEFIESNSHIKFFFQSRTVNFFHVIVVYTSCVCCMHEFESRSKPFLLTYLEPDTAADVTSYFTLKRTWRRRSSEKWFHKTSFNSLLRR